MTRILFLAFECPYPLDRGGRVKTYHFLRALALQNHVTLVAIVRNEQQSRDLAEHFAFCERTIGVPVDLSFQRKMWRLASSLPGPKPFVIALYGLPRLRRAIRSLVSREKFDVFYYDHLHMTQYRPKQVDVVHVIDEHNIETLLLKRVYQNMRFRPEKAVAWLEWQKMRRYEPRICREAEYVLATTEVDARLLRDWGVLPHRVRVIPIGVDTNYFQPVTNTHASCRDLTIIGTLGWPPNAEGVMWFYHNVFPEVRRVFPDAQLKIIGDRAPRSVAALNQDPNVSLLGYVDDIRSQMSDSAALLVPLRTGSGMRVKILDGLAMGVPIVSTAVGYEGIAVVDGEHLLSADQPRGFARAVISLLEQPDLRQRLASQGRELVAERYSWESVYKEIETFSEELCTRAGR